MRIAILEGETITRLEVISEKGLAEGWRPSEPWVDAGDDWKAGGTVIGGTYTAPVEPPAVPSSVTPAQAKIALYEAGLLDAVEALVLNYPYRPVNIWWTSALAFERGHAYLNALALELDLTDEQVDALFEAASKR